MKFGGKKTGTVNKYSSKVPGGALSPSKTGPLGYSLKGHLTVRPQVHGGKPSMKMGTGIYHGSNKSPTKGK